MLKQRSFYFTVAVLALTLAVILTQTDFVWRAMAVLIAASIGLSLFIAFIAFIATFGYDWLAKAREETEE